MRYGSSDSKLQKYQQFSALMRNIFLAGKIERDQITFCFRSPIGSPLFTGLLNVLESSGSLKLEHLTEVLKLAWKQVAFVDIYCDNRARQVLSVSAKCVL